MDPTLIDQLIEATGLPKEMTKKRFESILEEKGFDPANATLDDIRLVLTVLLQDLILNEEH